MKNKNTFVIVYYIILLLILSFRQDTKAEPPMVLRLAYLFAVLLPCLFSKSISYPAILTVFLTIGHYGYAYSYMPYMTYIYGILTLAMTFVLSMRHRMLKGDQPPFLVLFTVYIFLVDLIASYGNPQTHIIEDVTWCFVMLLCFFFFSEGKYENTRHQLSVAFALTSTLLSLYFLTNRTTFVRDYGYESGLERSGWADPNYFGMVIGMGTVMAIIKVLDKKWRHLALLEKALYIVTVIITIPTLILNASRGSIISLLSSLVVLVVLSKAKMGYKVVLVLLAVIGVVLLYQNQYFELLEYRIANEEGTMSGRTIIWKEKLEAYLQGDLMQLLFGYGFTAGFNITGRACGFHNDFLAFLVDYGIVGVGLLLNMLYYPFKIMSRKSHSRPVVLALTTFLVTCMLTLEPFTHALLAFFTLYFFIILSAKDKSVSFSKS